MNEWYLSTGITNAKAMPTAKKRGKMPRKLAATAGRRH